MVRADDRAKAAIMPTIEQVRKRLESLYATQKTFGKSLDNAAAGTWLSCLIRNNVNSDDFKRFVAWWTDHKGEIPTPSDCLDWIASDREKREHREMLEKTALIARQEDERRELSFQRNHPGEDPVDVIRELSARPDFEKPMPKALPGRVMPVELSEAETFEAHRRRDAILAHRLEALSAPGGRGEG